MSLVSLFLDTSAAPQSLMPSSETSHKALTAVNQLSLVPFLMSFLASRENLPLSTVTSAGMRLPSRVALSQELTPFSAQCLYVLTDDNYPASSEIKSNSSYSACLLEIAQARGNLPSAKGKSAKAEERATTLCVLACGMSPASSHLSRCSAGSDEKDM